MLCCATPTRVASRAQARDALRLFDSISGNFAFACVDDGRIGYQYTGRVPHRPCWVTPVPGWDAEHEWASDEVPKEALPAVLDPAGGVVFSANNQTVDAGFPYYLSTHFDRFRADRLRELLQQRLARGARIGVADCRAMQAPPA
jgi:penicillin amidase